MKVAGEAWLDLDNRDAQEAQRAKAVEFAQHYVDAFSRNPSGRVILEQWTREIRATRVPVDASVQVYAAIEAKRTFIEGIHAQLNLAQTEGR